MNTDSHEKHLARLIELDADDRCRLGSPLADWLEVVPEDTGRHLSTCEACQQVVTDLALLSDEAEAEDALPPTAEEEDFVTRLRERRLGVEHENTPVDLGVIRQQRERRWPGRLVLATAAAALLAAGLTLLPTATDDGPDGDGLIVDVSPTEPAHDEAADYELAAADLDWSSSWTLGDATDDWELETADDELGFDEADSFGDLHDGLSSALDDDEVQRLIRELRAEMAS
ncbi:MAG: hypothetical protein AAF533_22995 [Acidobacteriota bacterium]